jgi:hypothetical protein
MHFTRKYAFTLTVQHLPSQIKRRDLTPEARAGEGSSQKKREMKVYQIMTQLNKQKRRKLGGNLIALERKERRQFKLIVKERITFVD